MRWASTLDEQAARRGTPNRARSRPVEPRPAKELRFDHRWRSPWPHRDLGPARTHGASGGAPAVDFNCAGECPKLCLASGVPGAVGAEGRAENRGSATDQGTVRTVSAEADGAGPAEDRILWQCFSRAEDSVDAIACAPGGIVGEPRSEPRSP